MFDDMFRGWFEASEAGYSSFVKALMQGDLEAMNYYMNKVSLATFSHFDVGGETNESLEPERFYHGFVLGLMAERAWIKNTTQNWWPLACRRKGSGIMGLHLRGRMC